MFRDDILEAPLSNNVKNELKKLKMGTQKLNKSQVNAQGLPQTTLLHI